MSDQTATPLTDEEREELEALRAEKVRRAEEERARAERAELEALRAEQGRVDAEILAERAAKQASAAKGAMPRPAVQSAPAPGPKEKTFGERMVTSNAVDGDGIPTMPVAQKIIIAAALVAVVAFIIYTVAR